MFNATVCDLSTLKKIKPQIIRTNLPITAQNRCPFNRILQHTDIARKHLPQDQLLRLSVIGVWHAIPRIATAWVICKIGLDKFDSQYIFIVSTIPRILRTL